MTEYKNSGEIIGKVKMVRYENSAEVVEGKKASSFINIETVSGNGGTEFIGVNAYSDSTENYGGIASIQPGDKIQVIFHLHTYKNKGLDNRTEFKTVIIADKWQKIQ